MTQVDKPDIPFHQKVPVFPSAKHFTRALKGLERRLTFPSCPYFFSGNAPILKKVTNTEGRGRTGVKKWRTFTNDMFVTFHELCDEFQANLSWSETPNFKNKKADITIWADLLYFTHS